MKIKFLILLSLMLQSPQLFPADSYNYKGEKVLLEARKDKLAVILRNNFSEMSTTSTLQNFFGSDAEIKRAAGNVFLINFPVPKSNSEIDNYINSLNQQDGEIKFAANVYYGSSKKVSQIVTDKFIVRLRNSSDIAKLSILNLQNNCSIVSTFKDGKNFVIVSNNEVTKNALELSAIYYASGIFEYTEPDMVYPEGCLLLSIPNDPLFSTQWSIKNTGQLLLTGSAFLFQGDLPTVTGIPGSDMNVEEAWNVTTGSPSVKIGVIDSGIDSSHIDFQAPGHLLPGYDAFTNTNSSAVDVFNHGTSTAGLIGAAQNNNIGISGVAPDCALMSISIFDINGSTSNSIIERAFDTAVARGIDVLSNSWGGGTPSQTITDAIDNAAINGRNGLGCIIFFGSGNDGNNPPVYPSVLPNVVCVGASTPHDQKKAPGTGNQFFWGSNYGSDNIGDIDLVAPTNCQTLSPGNAFEPNFWGTSATCPNAAGVAGLILSVNSSQSRQQVISSLLKGCDKIDNVPYSSTKAYGKWNNYYGYGRINAYNSVMLASGQDVTSPSINHTNVSSHSSTYPTIVKAEITDENGSSVPTSGNNAPKLFFKIKKGSGSWSSFDSLNSISTAGNEFTFKIPSQGWETEVYYYLRARDNSGNETTFPKHAPHSFWLCYYTVGNITAETKKVSSFSGADFGPTLSPSVNFGSFKILHAKVKIYLRHTWLGDESIQIFAPLSDANNNRKCLFANNGEDLDNITGTNVTDSSSQWWIQGTPPYLNSTYKPDYTLTGLNGQNANGNWRILHFDRAIGDYAFFDSVKITLCKTTGITSSSVRLNSPVDSIIHFDSSSFPNSYDKNFYLKNSGTANLTLSNFTISGTYSSLFSIINTPPSTIIPGDSALFKIRLNTNAGRSGDGDAPVQNAVLSIQTNDPAKPFFKVSLQTTDSLNTSLKNLQLTALIEGMYNVQTNSMVADTVTVSLRSFSSPYELIESSKGILSTSGTGSFDFSAAQNNTNYYLVIVHRNALETWSGTGSSFSSSVMNYDFTGSLSQAYGGNMVQKGNEYCLYSGEVTGDGAIDVDDVTSVYNSSQTFSNGYIPQDINGDNFIDISDLIPTYNNNIKFITVINP